jgi:molybdopterin/thiamine biosynthesis adenylyltransferase
MAVNALRHMKLFNPDDFNPKRIDVIGVGATGSWLVTLLTRLGITNIHVWDFDIVESHNVANQVFGNNDIGKFKVDALKERVKNDTGIEITTHNERVTGSTSGLGEIVFLLVDNMDVRKEIWEGALKFQFHIGLVVETRFGFLNDGITPVLRIWSINPTDPEQVERWEACFYDSSGDTQASACGATQSICTSAAELAVKAANNLMEWHRIQRGGKGYLPLEQTFYPTLWEATPGPRSQES